ncbi:MAG: CDP-alcohol phosphatidyltransferase family protein [Vicinamibacterales bacterium]
MTPTATAHVRENLGLVAGAEKRTLLWIAGRLPEAINSDHLSGLGLASMVTAGLSFALFPFNPPAAALGVVASLAANWFGDSLDGTVARVRLQQRPRYGFYVDHVIDVAGTAMLMTGLGLSGLMRPLMAATLLGAYLLVSAETFLATHSVGTFRMSFLGFGPTELRLLLCAGALKAADSPWVTLGEGTHALLFEIGGAIAISGLLVAFVVSAVRNTRALYSAEPMPSRQKKLATIDTTNRAPSTLEVA